MAEMTSARALNDLLMAWVSFSLSPSTFVKLSRSEPAKSIRERVTDLPGWSEAAVSDVVVVSLSPSSFYAGTTGI